MQGINLFQACPCILARLGDSINPQTGGSIRVQTDTLKLWSKIRRQQREAQPPVLFIEIVNN